MDHLNILLLKKLLIILPDNHWSYQEEQYVNIGWNETTHVYLSYYRKKLSSEI